ncbi:integrase, catalytic region, zinc finger, CCHC-type containing protein [Tanacetum coccineum]
MAKATSSQAWLWHRRLSHLNFDIINLLSKNNIVNGLLKLKFVKDHLCSSCELGKAKEKSFTLKTTRSSNKTGFNFYTGLMWSMAGNSLQMREIRHKTSTASTPEQNGGGVVSKTKPLLLLGAEHAKLPIKSSFVLLG